MFFLFVKRGAKERKEKREGSTTIQKWIEFFESSK